MLNRKYWKPVARQLYAEGMPLKHVALVLGISYSRANDWVFGVTFAQGVRKRLGTPRTGGIQNARSTPI